MIASNWLIRPFGSRIYLADNNMLLSGDWFADGIIVLVRMMVEKYVSSGMNGDKMKNDVRETYRQLLLNYPNIFPCPLDVSCHLFTTLGGGFEWDDSGKLVSLNGLERDGPPLHKRERRKNVPECLVDLETRYDLKEEAEELRYRFVCDNMERILDSGPTASYFSSGVRHSPYITTNLCYDGTARSKGFEFPPQITHDWADVLLKFMQWWQTNLRIVYRVDHDGNIGDWWPKEARGAYTAIGEVIARLYPIVTGMSYEEIVRRHNETAEKLREKFASQGNS